MKIPLVFVICLILASCVTPPYSGDIDKIINRYGLTIIEAGRSTNYASCIKPHVVDGFPEEQIEDIALTKTMLLAISGAETLSINGLSGRADTVSLNDYIISAKQTQEELIALTKTPSSNDWASNERLRKITSWHDRQFWNRGLEHTPYHARKISILALQASYFSDERDYKAIFECSRFSEAYDRSGGGYDAAYNNTQFASFEDSQNNVDFDALVEMRKRSSREKIEKAERAYEKYDQLKDLGKLF